MSGLKSDTRLINELCAWAGVKPSRMAADLNLAVTTLTRPASGKATTRLGRGTIESLRRAYPDFPGWDAEAVAPDQSPTVKSEDGSIPLRHVDMSLSMGDGSNIDDYFEEGVFEFDAGLLRGISRAPAHRLVVAKGIGDSMMPTIHDDAMVIFDTTQTDLNVDDKIWAVSVYGAGGIKRLQKIARDRVLVISDNSIVPNREVSIEDLRILGRVVWSARRH